MSRKIIRQLTTDSRSLPKLTTSCFKKEAIKKTVENLVSISIMNCSEFAITQPHIFETLYQVVQMMIKGFQSRFKVVGRSIYIYIYIYPVQPEQDVFEQIELGLQADNEPH